MIDYNDFYVKKVQNVSNLVKRTKVTKQNYFNKNKKNSDLVKRVEEYNHSIRSRFNSMKQEPDQRENNKD